jgi:hypothetical protein
MNCSSDEKPTIMHERFEEVESSRFGAAGGQYRTASGSERMLALKMIY